MGPTSPSPSAWCPPSPPPTRALPVAPMPMVPARPRVYLTGPLLWTLSPATAHKTRLLAGDTSAPMNYGTNQTPVIGGAVLPRRCWQWPRSPIGSFTLMIPLLSSCHPPPKGSMAGDGRSDTLLLEVVSMQTLSVCMVIFPEVHLSPSTT